MTIEITSVKLSHGVVTITAIDCSEEHLQYMERAGMTVLKSNWSLCLIRLPDNSFLISENGEGTESGQTGNYLG